MARQDQANDAVFAHLVPLRRQRRLYRAAACALRGRPAVGRPRSGATSSRALKDDADRCQEECRRAPPGRSRTGRSQANGELVSALDGNWGVVEKVIEKKVKDKAAAERRRRIRCRTCIQATRDSVRAIMMIRAYPHARPSARQSRSARHRQAARGLQRAVAVSPMASPKPTTTARSSSTTCSGWNTRPSAEMIDILTRTYCSTLGVEFMHISDPEEKAWIQERIEGAGQGHRLHRRGQEGDPAQADRGRGLRAVHRRQVQGHQALRPRWRRIADPGAGADHQARRPARPRRRSCSAWPIAAA